MADVGLTVKVFFPDAVSDNELPFDKTASKLPPSTVIESADDSPTVIVILLAVISVPLCNSASFAASAMRGANRKLTMNAIAFMK